jgi:hypothetical protein
MEIILNPIMREKITIAGDIPLRNKDFLREISQVYQPLFGNRINMTLMEPLVSGEIPWYFHSFHRNEFTEIQEFAKANGNEDLTGGLMQFIYETFPRRVEEILSTKWRCDEFRKFLRAYVKSRADVGESSDAGKVIVVGHSMFFRVYTT